MLTDLELYAAKTIISLTKKGIIELISFLGTLKAILGDEPKGHISNPEVFIDIILLKHLKDFRLDLESLERAYGKTSEDSSYDSKKGLA